ncbi:MAG: ribosome recycling factor [Oscillospiraceae bacterium]
MKEKINTAKDKMQKSIASYEHELKSIRAGRANPSILDKITVEYYGVPTKIDQMAAISVPEARTLLIQPWDPSVLSQIEKAINAADTGINPTNDGKVIRMMFPPLTEERRKDIVKDVHKLCEECKDALRAIRREANEKIKAMKKDSGITEDDIKSGEEQIQKLTDKFCKEADEISKAKEIEIMSV